MNHQTTPKGARVNVYLSAEALALYNALPPRTRSAVLSDALIAALSLDAQAKAAAALKTALALLETRQPAE
jgi:hypothetical protein